MGCISEMMDSVNLRDDFYNPNTGSYYKIGKKLGKGGFSEVFSALQYSRNQTGIGKKENAKKVALKIVPRKRVEKEEQIVRIDEEIVIQRRLKHPNIVKIFASFRDEEKICLVLEYCNEMTLGDLIKSQPTKTLSERRSAEIFSQVISALNFLHSLGILHRDIKLGNILLKDGRAKVADFGLAIDTNKTKQICICGTPNFLAPEVFQKRQHYATSDVWAAGCVLFCMLVGRPPFKYTSLSSTRKKIQNLSFDLPSALSSEAKDLINSIITYDYCRASALGISRSAFIAKYAPQTLEYLSSPILQVAKENMPPVPSFTSKLPVQISKMPEQNMQRV
ncbi:unnamed protein product [Oikopleura dioica]|uniref:non-specific serine/threonine protein kinase n=1 Tax=Oikopleura dioica TaxID=34765 RepID=E4XI86_OIKDI|nr:unnamed protein product [Oikopleura dioica]